MILSLPLLQAFSDHPLGLCGAHDPAKVVSSIEILEQRLSVLALGVVLDTNPLSQERWSTLVTLHDHWLLDSSQVAYQSSARVLTAMQETHTSGPQYIARVWWQICQGVQGRYKGSWRELLRANNDDARTIQNYLQKSRATFPVLAGPIISARWLDLVHRIGGVALQGWETLTIKLPSSQRKAARVFGITMDEVHPLLSTALNVWQASCRKLPEGLCGFTDCPNNQN